MPVLHNCGSSCTEKVARWGCPSGGHSSTRFPKTSVGKLDKKTVRATHGAGRFDIVEINTIAKDA
ncbi:hypothetical protein [Pseudonocardia sp. P1]|uniref:hypothetical protein n=1 Tax=Pseudonocardia sp. P1 TaxID=761194 RepID=UPI00307E3787